MKIKLLFMGSRGFYGFGLYEVKILSVRIMGVTLVEKTISVYEKALNPARIARMCP